MLYDGFGNTVEGAPTLASDQFGFIARDDIIAGKSVFVLSATAGVEYTFVQNSAGDGVTVWGDGTTDEMLTHTYAADGIYIVQTDNTLDTSNNYANDTRTSVIDVLQISDKMTTMAHFFRKTSLQSVRCKLPDVADYTYAFYSVMLKTPPILPEGIENLTRAFELCTWMGLLPILPSTVKNASYCFKNTRCEVPATNWPAALTNVTEMYNGAYIIETGEPWDSISPGSTTDCFGACNNLDLDAIPATWGGNAE